MKTVREITKQNLSFAKFLHTHASICIHIQPDTLDAKVTTEDNGVDLRIGPRRSVCWGCGLLVWGTGAQGHLIHNTYNLRVLSRIMYN